MAWPSIEVVEAERVRLEPLTVDHAESMVDVLADASLYRFTGGQPPTLSELQRRYAMQTIGQSDDGSQWWLNWIVQARDSARAIGYVQATVQSRDAIREASIAWVISPDIQGRGLATEAASAMVGWLKLRGVERFVAEIHPGHAASQSVARKLGLRPSTSVEDGEVRWQSFAE